ncbi:MAG TPA: universal stress protein [Bosea sp. (in: a-proteobacteria)]|jgi:nucleotide-binding universal stress UspA family protein|uniref:universal stress protein n=1 Tax=Bosea sp. (in: a-proteobacteria) TaxID=1871050 RepID=UPI002E143F5E|nr:universal stress protein [Bosea sp. (in: a-proteobacteria)]
MSSIRPSAETPRYGGVLVPVHLGAGAEATVRFAARLARELSCRLIGTGGDEVELPYFGDGTGIVDAVLVENARVVVQEDLAKAEALFRRVAAGADLVWRCAVEQPRSLVLTQARAADLVILARQGPDDEALGRMGVAPGDIVLELGRPVLVVPPGVETLAARSVVVAWKDTREARRAVRDALPFLARAELVSVFTVGADDGDHPAQEVCGYLAQHGIAARAVQRPDRGEYVVDEIAELVRQQSADLIVAGAYGHSRMREWIFGGVTQDLIETTPVCCLLSH